MSATFLKKSPNIGYLELIIGPMFSGKTTSLINLDEIYRTKLGMTCFLINHSDDQRYGKVGDGLMMTHDRKSIKAHHTSKLMDLLKYSSILNYDAILINEGQFFPDLIEFVLCMVEVHKKKVHIAGLNGDFRKKEFGEILKLIPHCDDVRKLSADCGICKDKGVGLFSMRKSFESCQKVVGASNYVPVCRVCYEIFAQSKFPDSTVTK